MFGFSEAHLFILLLIVLIIFGPSALPKLAKSVGRAVHDFKGGLSGIDKEIQEQSGPSDVPAAKIESKPEPMQTAEKRESVKQEEKN